MNGQERANLVNICLKKLHEAGVDVVSLTCDGPPCNFSMISSLGASLDMDNFQTHFNHPLALNKKVYVLLDICHMIKLVRNTLGKGLILIDKDGGKISWQYIVELEKIQRQEGLRLGNKLKRSHIDFRQQVMKVSLATQALSKSRADAIEHCNKALKLQVFKGSEATVKFIRLVDYLFDVLNSRNPLALGSKAPLRQNNKRVWKPFFEEAFHYFLHLKESTGVAMYKSKRKTGFVGFMAGIRSTKKIFEECIEN